MVEIIGNVIHTVIVLTDKQLIDRKRRRAKAKAARTRKAKERRKRRNRKK